jgi:hypothetical protein
VTVGLGAVTVTLGVGAASGAVGVGVGPVVVEMLVVGSDGVVGIRLVSVGTVSVGAGCVVADGTDLVGVGVVKVAPACPDPPPHAASPPTGASARSSATHLACDVLVLTIGASIQPRPGRRQVIRSG